MDFDELQYIGKNRKFSEFELVLFMVFAVDGHKKRNGRNESELLK